jgi:pyruvate dehydrogenase E2 component (dihydrolipoamide acetyltransferase)
MIEIRMPQLGESVTEGTITSWCKKPGDAVNLDEFICEISTDKVTFEVPSPKAGVLLEVLAAEGAIVPVGAVIARLAAEASPAAASLKAQDEKPAQAAALKLTAPMEQTAARPAILSPLVRRLARQAGVDLSVIAGGGRNGRVTRDDVLKAIGERGEQSTRPALPPQGWPAPGSISVPAAFRPVAADGDSIVPFSVARQKIAEHMVYSVQASPHGFISFEVDYGAIDKVRKKRNDGLKAEHGVSLTYLPFVLRALTVALRKFPLINSAVDGNRLIVRKNIHIGIAVDLAYQGLMVPVIRDVDSLNLVGLARALAELAAAARSNKLKPDATFGGTFTVTNPGPSGTHLSIPIINQPQAAILVTDGVHKKPSVVTLPDGSDVVAIRPKGFVGLSMDHRAFDGAYAADFMRMLKGQLEDRDWDGEF